MNLEYWTTKDGEELKISEMGTAHIFFCVRMLYNHSVPAAYQIIGCRYYPGLDMDAETRKDYMIAFIKELLGRKNLLEDWMVQQLNFMRNNIKEIKTKQIKV